MRTTTVLITLCVLGSLLYWATHPFGESYVVYSGERVAKGAFWTLVTSLFVHFDLSHLVGNMIFFYVFGTAFEEEAGGKAITIAFLIGGVGSFLASSMYYGLEVSMIGASAAIFTLAAAAMLVKPLRLSLLFLFIPLGLVAVLYLIFNVLAVLLGFGGNVGYVAHVIGFIIGIPFGIAFSKGKWVKNLGITILLFIAFAAILYLLELAPNLL